MWRACGAEVAGGRGAALRRLAAGQGRAGPSAEPARAPRRPGSVSGSNVAGARLPLLCRAPNSAGKVREG